MHIAIIAAFNGFRDEELLQSHKIFLDNDIDTEVYSSHTGMTLGKFGASFQINKTIDQVDINKIEALIIIGGLGVYNFLGNKKIHQLIASVHNSNKLIAAICMAPLIIAETGLLKNRKATVFSAEKGRIIEMGASYTRAAVEYSDNIITANNADATKKFANKIVSHLKGKL